MSPQTDVLVHHSVPAVFGTGVARELHERLQEDLPDGTEVGLSTPSHGGDRAVGSAEVVLAMRPVSEGLDEASAPDWLQTLNSGTDAYDLDRLRELGVVVTNAAGVAANPIAEQVLGYMLAFERRIHTGIRQQERRGIWQRYSGGELAGKTVGLVGIGAIGSRVAELASAFGTEVIGTKRTPETAPEVVDEARPPEALAEVLVRADYVVLACPLVEATRGLIGADELAAMGSDAVLVNIARGEVVDEPALETALQERRIRGAALDVFETEPLPQESPFWDLPNAIVTPHMSGSTPRYAERIGDLFVENYRAYAAGDLDGLENRVV